MGDAAEIIYYHKKQPKRKTKTKTTAAITTTQQSQREHEREPEKERHMQAPIDDDDNWRVEKVALVECIRAKCHGITSLEICAVGDSVLSHHVVQVVFPEHMVACCPRSLDCGFLYVVSHFVKSIAHHTTLYHGNFPWHRKSAQNLTI